jgi:hypothetical protein
LIPDLLAWIRVYQKLISRYDEIPIPSHGGISLMW